MSNYVPHHCKKLWGLERRECDLLRILRRRGRAEAVLLAAAGGRAARARVLRAKRAQFLPSGGPFAERFAKIDGQIDRCESTPIGEIVAEFRRRLATEGDVETSREG